MLIAAAIIGRARQTESRIRITSMAETGTSGATMKGRTVAVYARTAIA